MPDEVFHIEAFFSGRVQGVGFRYKTYLIAREYEITGHVTNLNDGRVHLEAEGSEDETRGFLRAVQDRLSPFIRQAEVHCHQRPASFRGFVLR